MWLHVFVCSECKEPSNLDTCDHSYTHTSFNWHQNSEYVISSSCHFQEYSCPWYLNIFIDIKKYDLKKVKSAENGENQRTHKISLLIISKLRNGEGAPEKYVQQL